MRFHSRYPWFLETTTLKDATLVVSLSGDKMHFQTHDDFLTRDDLLLLKLSSETDLFIGILIGPIYTQDPLILCLVV